MDAVADVLDELFVVERSVVVLSLFPSLLLHICTLHVRDWAQRRLLVHSVVLLRIAVAKMNRQRRKERDALVDLNQLGADAPVLFHLHLTVPKQDHHDTSRNSKIPIQPRTPDAAAVRFNTELAIAVRLNL